MSVSTYNQKYLKMEDLHVQSVLVECILHIDLFFQTVCVVLHVADRCPTEQRSSSEEGEHVTFQSRNLSNTLQEIWDRIVSCKGMFTD